MDKLNLGSADYENKEGILVDNAVTKGRKYKKRKNDSTHEL